MVFPNKIKLVLLVIGFNINATYAQVNIEGSININVSTGHITCDFELSNIPKITSYVILLNKGMNIKYFKNSNSEELINYDGYYNGKIKGEGIQYTFADNFRNNIELPNSFKISYSGAFPIYNNELASFDYKGKIVVNEKTFRASEQSKWYPVIYDIENDRLLENVTYSIKVTTASDNTIFINGNPPTNGNNTLLKSKKAVPLLLFVGDYDYVNENGNYILNANIDTPTSSRIFKEIEKIKQIYAEKLKLEFDDDIFIIKHRAVKPIPQGGAWGFNSYPSFLFAGLDFSQLVVEGHTMSPKNVLFFAHELGHNYFGNNVNSGKLSWFWVESTAQFLSFIIAQEINGKEFIDKTLVQYAGALKTRAFKPLATIENPKEISLEYRLIYGPLIWQCFKDIFGADITYKVLNELVNVSEQETLSIEIWKKAAIKYGVENEKINEFVTNFLKDSNAMNNVVDSIIKNH
ncbi:MAG: hypothetical protein HWD85_07920 [Flavobacteriaceae bacterium]|nr:hypothetical protein [Flavobacteriaceae bacterium]